MKPVFTANCRYVAILNFAVDPRILAPLVPPETELDCDAGETFISFVASLLLDTRIPDRPLPRQREFEELDLRFYVRQKSADVWRRGVASICRIVPRDAVAVVGPVFPGERLTALAMKHEIEHRDGHVMVQYSWRQRTRWDSLKMITEGESQNITAGSHADFVTERHWGFPRSGSEYQLKRARWKIWSAKKFELRADMAALYGEEFAETLRQAPRSAFIADGSPITVLKRIVENL